MLKCKKNIQNANFKSFIQYVTIFSQITRLENRVGLCYIFHNTPEDPAPHPAFRNKL